MKSILTWGIGYGKSRELAEANAQLDARVDKIKIRKLDKLEIERCNLVENKKDLAKLNGELPGIILQNCAKSDVISVLAFGITEDKIFIGKGKAAGKKAEEQATHEAKKAAGDSLESLQHIAAKAEYKKDIYGCAIVALVVIK